MRSSVIVSVTSFSAGNSYNILADQAVLKGTIRSSDETNRRRAQRRVKEIATAIATAFGATIEFDLVVGEPPVVNHPDVVDVVTGAVKDFAGEGAILNAPGWSAADDFGFYSEKVPSVYFRLGVRSDLESTVYPLHHQSFQVDEDALPLGVMTLVASARDFLSGDKSSSI
jgi:metal-dependent amidase/aminoacylase/carboxypeptidase family protein